MLVIVESHLPLNVLRETMMMSPEPQRLIDAVIVEPYLYLNLLLST